MKLSATILPLLLANLVAARSLSLFGSESVIKDEDSELAVPGNNPLLYCQKSTDDILEIDYVDLNPNPPAAGKSLIITASGTLSQDVEDGAYVNLSVKYGLIRLINQKFMLCDEAKNIDLKCPIKKGPMEIVKEVELPKEIPPGKYTVLADVYTKDDKKITCLTATVTFGAGHPGSSIKLDLRSEM
ncbi:MAG: Phosphatidylglycerol/phosphatidylinositol transfer protein [Cirrosporium novae-zelandiae]|nr:MAG: Phosphatidylglycerol/phosphatidylinositol transfer protein [Cirrosporium novae-zelandiae]